MATPLRVQDPFVLSHNITQNINEKGKQFILEEFNRAHKLCQPEGDKVLVQLLFDDFGPNAANSESPDESHVKTDSQPAMSDLNSSSSDFCVDSFEVFMQAWRNVDFYGNGASAGHERWCQRVVAFVPRVLREVLYMEVTCSDLEDLKRELESPCSQKKMKLEQGVEKGTLYVDGALLKLKCQTDKQMWHGRKRAMKSIDKDSGDVLQSELSCSRYMLQHSNEFNVSSGDTITFDLCLAPFHSISGQGLKFNLSAQNPPRSYKVFFTFFRQLMCRLIEKCL